MKSKNSGNNPPIPFRRKQFDLEGALERISHWFPTQGPIKDFIHHNTLHAFMNRPFHEAVAVASELYGALDYLPLDEYRHLFRQGRISDEGIFRSLKKSGVPDGEKLSWRERLLSESHDEKVPPGRARSGMRARWLEERGVDLDLLVHPMLFKILSGFLDQGISIWRMPHATDTFWNAVSRLISESRLPIAPLSDRRCRELFLKSAADAAAECLHLIVGNQDAFEPYLLEMLLSHPGWSGMVRMVEREPQSLVAARKISLLELTAVELVFELGWLTRKLGSSFRSIAYGQTVSSPPLPEKIIPSPSPLRVLKRIWHEAWEWTLYNEFLRNLTHPRPIVSAPERPAAQAFFCLDDRACSLRRHLEEIRPDIATYGTAGFFGIDFLFQRAGSEIPVQYCPIIVTPRHVVRETVTHPSTDLLPHLSQLLQFNPETNTLFRGWLLTQTMGIWASLRLALKVFYPGSRLLADTRITRVDHPTKLHLLRESDETTQEGFWIGYSISEMVERVHAVLQSVGLGESFSRLIVFFGHGSTSANNPHFAAYDCGACAGKPGAPNARAFAWMANHPDVRVGLAAKGVKLPDDCHFVGAIVDTARDEVAYFDTELLPKSHEGVLREFDVSLKEALGRNAVERCQRFELAPTKLSQKAALRHVHERASSIFEPRPELNHATNAFCIVGRRALTQGLFLDRRAFLNSYDPSKDPSGDILASILSAVVPVCGGINLEYLFSRMDNVVYGAGTKLPHNVVSLLGVANGVEGDLRTGLPSQMIEIHEPIRLFLLVDQEPKIALKAARKNPHTFEWIKHEWVVFACWSASEDRPYVFDSGEMISVELAKDSHGPAVGRVL